MRFLIIAISVFALATGAFAQTTQKPPTPPSPPATPAPATPATPALATGTGLDLERRAHPDWFTEPSTYKPCPASVVFPDGRPACLGCPTSCRWHFPR
jgi:hypothetical protein